MNLKRRQLTFITACIFLISFQIYGQENDTTLYPGRDIIGDLNESSIRKGEFPGAILLPGTNVSLAIGGFIKSTIIYDTKFNVKDEIIRPGGFSSNDFLKGQTLIGARSSRLFFDGRAFYDEKIVRGYIEMDFRGSNGITIRHIYLKISNKGGQSLLMGQYWSRVMNLQTTPEGLVEPTMSGGPFSRHGQLSFSTPLNKIFSFIISLEDPNNSDIKGEDIQVLNRYPDLITSLSVDPFPSLHISAMGMLRPIGVMKNGEVLNKTGFLSNISGLIKPSKNQKIILSGFYGKGASNYLMGSDGTAGYVFNNEIDFQNQYGGYISYRYQWNEKLRSNFGLGRFAADRLTNNPNPHSKSSTYGFVNTLYRLNKYVNIGIEWIYTEKINYNGGSFNNNRFQIGVQVF